MSKATETFTVEKATQMVKAVALLHDSVGTYINENNNRPTPQSQAYTELHEFVKPEFIRAAYSQANALIEVAGDHLYASTRVLTELVQTIAPWNCVRAVLETSAIAAWILDPELDAKVRVSRSFAFRYEGLAQQLKFAQACKERSLINDAEKRITEVEAEALALGFERVEDRKGNRIGIAEKMPSNTNVIREVLDEEVSYRLLSAMTHAHHWAYQQLGFEVIHEGDRVFLEKSLKPIYVAYLCSIAVKAFLKPVSYFAQLNGWDSDRLSEAIKPGLEILSTPVKSK